MRVVHYQPQRSTGTERGLRSWRMCRSIPVVANQPQDWPRKRAGLMWGGYGRPTLHHLNFRTQPTWQGIADVLPSHFHKSPSVWGAETLASEKSEYAPKLIGEARSV